MDDVNKVLDEVLRVMKDNLVMADDADSTSTAGLEVALCWCGKNPASSRHSCPFADEINDNHDQEHCTCCDDCRRECCLDI